MATSKGSEKQTGAPANNPSGASEEQLKKGEMAGKVRGRDVDSSYHDYEFTDPATGEPVEWTPVVHDVAVGTDGSGGVVTEKGDSTFAKPAEGADTKQSQGANQGESGEKGEKK